MPGQPTVYVVDDDEDIRRSLRWLFESVRIPVEAFASAEDFLRDLGSNRSGCLVLDVRMPDMDGLDLLQQLQVRHVSLPVIIITGHSDVPMAVKAMQRGAIDFLEKPVNHQYLLERVRTAMRPGQRH